MGDLDLFTPEERAGEPVDRHRLVPLGHGWGAATVMRMPAASERVFRTPERRHHRGPVERESLDRRDVLGRDLAPALFLSTCLRFETAKAPDAPLTRARAALRGEA